jgi:hypothetical protein
MERRSIRTRMGTDSTARARRGLVNMDGLRLVFLRLDGWRSHSTSVSRQAMVHVLIKIGYDHDFRTLNAGMIFEVDDVEWAFAGSTDTYEFLATIVPAKNRG